MYAGIVVHCSFSVGQDIRIYSDPTPPNFPPDITMTITCQYPTSLTFRHIVHPTIGIISASTGRFMIETFSDESTLYIMETQMSDEGFYKCVMSELQHDFKFLGRNLEG